MPDDIAIRRDRRPGDDALIVALHGGGYGQEGAKFDGATTHFPEYVAETVAEARLDEPSGSRVWFVEKSGRAVGCAAVIDRGDRGQLRWVVLMPELRGLGVGRRLVEAALDHARAQGWREVYLETTDGLDASMALYENLGFKTVKREDAELWHGPGVVVTMALSLQAD